MESVVEDESPVHFGDDTAEESEPAVVDDPSSEKTPQEISDNSVGSSSLDSLKATVKSATGLIPASLGGGSVDQVDEEEGPPVPDEDIDTDFGKEAQASGDEKVMGEELSPEGTITDVTADGWSVVDQFSGECAEEQSQVESVSTGVQGEEEEEETCEVRDPDLSEESQSSSSDVTAEPEVQEEDSQTTTPISGYVADTPFVPWSSSASSLRRRPRSFAKETKGDVINSVDALCSSFQETGDISAMAECEAAFQPASDPLSGAPGATEVGGSHNSADALCSSFQETGDISAMAECEAAFQPASDPLSGAPGATEVGGSRPQNEDCDNSVPKVENSDDLTPRKESEVRFGYDPEREDDDNSDASSLSSREADHGVIWKRRRSQPDEGTDEIVSSSDEERKAPPIPPETKPPQRREVYKMPDGGDAEVEDGGESPTQLLVHPAGFIVRAVEFQLNLIVHVIATSIWVFSFTLSTLSHPISRTLAVTDKVTSVTNGAATQVSELFSFFGDGVSQTGPTLGKLSKRTFWGCLTVAYVLCMLGLLLIPALVVDIVIVNSMMEEPVVIRQALDFDFTQPKPVAMLPLFSSKEIERIQSLAPEKTVSTRVIPLGNKFHVTVVLTLPESDYNMNLGMFQVTAELLSARDEVIMRSSKPCRLRFRSSAIQFVNAFVYALPHLVGLSKEAQTIEIRLLEAQEKVTPTASVRILIEPKASFRDGGGVPEIYEAAVKLETTVFWPRVIRSSWKWLFFVWNGVCLFLFEVSIVLCCCRQMIIPNFGRKAIAEEEVVVGEVKDERAVKDVIRGSSSRRGRGNRRVYFEDGTPRTAGTHDRRERKMLKNQ